MIPFVSFLYFGLVAYVAVPALVARRFNLSARAIILIPTLLMVVAQYALGSNALAATPVRDVARILGFAVGQYVVAAVFLRVRLVGRRKVAFYAAIGLSLLPLALEKFLPTRMGGLVGFVGISYVTFRALDIIFVIEDGLQKELSVAEYFSFLLFFPALSAGPIDRYRRFRGDFRQARSRDDLGADLDRAMQRLFRGLLYSFVIARLVDVYWLIPASHTAGIRGVISYMYAYSMYLFFDFAGYSALAIGVGYLFGVRMPENFDKPFLAKNIVEFWHRWHITLATWLRDHVFGRFVLAATKGKWFKNRQLSGYLGSLLAFGLMGLWHGVAARYICYGLYHAGLIIGYGILTRAGRARRPLPTWAARLVTFNAVCVGFLIFSGRLF